MSSNGKSPITEWYNEKSIFITGGTGFMGKVLLEKLLYSCSGIKNIYILIRPKKGKNPEQRIEDMWKIPLFNRLRESQPHAIKKIVPIQGDLYTEGLGLSKSDLDLLVNNVQIVFHVAATLKLEATLKDAVEQNTNGTARVIDVAKQIKNLLAFIHFSTAFCSADIDVFEEKVYPCKDDPRKVIDVSRWIDESAFKKITPDIIAPHPNTYTYSKRLAETLVANEAENIPVCIIRPSIVTPAGLEPLPGWVDSLNGPMGLLVGAGKGVIRSMHGIPENKAQVIPVDVAINATIVVAQKLGSRKTKSKEVLVYNLTQGEVIPISMGEVLERGRKVVYENPFEGQIWYPDGDLRRSKTTHLLYTLMWHWLPAYFIDFIMLLIRQRRFMVRLQWRIHNGLELLEFFTIREFKFRSSNFLNLNNEITEADRKIFPMDLTIMSIDDYLKICLLGARQYLMKEDLSSLPSCRRRQKLMYVLHVFCVYGFYFYVLWSILSISPIKSFMLSTAETVGIYTPQ